AAREYAGGFDNDPGRLQALEERRDVLYRLKQKYGETLDAVLTARRTGAEELDLLDTAELDLRGLAARVAAAAETARRAAEALTARRTAGAERLARAVNRILPKLGLGGGRLSVV